MARSAERYGPHTHVYNRFNRWARAGVWVKVFEVLAAKSPKSMALIDSSIIRAHRRAAGGKKGARITFSWRTEHQDQRCRRAGAAHADGRAGSRSRRRCNCRHVVADRGYDADALLKLSRASGAKAHIPSTRSRLIQRTVNRGIHRQRNLVERYFNKLKHFRRIATRFEKLARNFLAAVALVSSRLWLRTYESRT